MSKEFDVEVGALATHRILVHLIRVLVDAGRMSDNEARRSIERAGRELAEMPDGGVLGSRNSEAARLCQDVLIGLNL